MSPALGAVPAVATISWPDGATTTICLNFSTSSAVKAPENATVISLALIAQP